MARTRRFFFALWPDERVRQALISARDRLVAAQARAVLDGNMHLTLAFIGNVTPGLVDALADAGSGVSCAGCALTLDTLERRKGMLWLTPSDTPADLPVLYAAIWDSVERNTGIPREHRRFRPHITLARKHISAPRELDIEPIRWPVKSFALVESVQEGRVSVYRPVRSFPLT